MRNSAFDILVIGGGPAGLIAAGRAAELGSRVALLEKNTSPGRKLLLTGNGRCNLTNGGDNLRGLVEKYGVNGKFLYHAFSVFGVEETVDFFKKNGLPTKVEENGRVFPASERAADVLRVLLAYTKRVQIFTGAAVEGFAAGEGGITGVKVSGDTVTAENYILCTGGKSFPKTGSTGEAFDWLRSLGHKIVSPEPALAPVKVMETWLKEMEGASIRDARISVLQSGKKKAFFRGEAVVTASGLSGPVILDMSRKVRELARGGEVTLRIDLLPDKSKEELEKEILRMRRGSPNRLVKNAILDFVPPKLAGALLKLSELDGDRQINGISKKEERALLEAIKSLPLTIKGTLGFERAMVTSGGVSLKEIDSMTMRSRLYDNLYFAGEVIDIDGPTGGYNLQVAWSTGYLAGQSAADEK